MTPIDKLVHELSKLPGIGERTATRLVFHILKEDPDYARALSQAICDLKEKVRLCSECLNLTEIDPCSICRDFRRDKEILCVVEEPSDMLAVERTQAFKGSYHVLHGAISPLDGIGPDDIKISDLVKRIGKGSIREIIIATNANIEGEATALYLTRLIKPSGVKVTRLASGIPVGGALEYIDASTLMRAFEDRREL